MAKPSQANIYFPVLVITSVVIGLISFLYFQSQPKVYQSTGKFSVSYLSSQDAASSNVYTSNYNANLQAGAKSLTEGIKSRVFVNSLLNRANVQFGQESLNNIDQYISAEVIKESNIVSVEIYSNNLGSLNDINKIFLTTLNSSDFVKNQDPKIEVKTVDPLYSNDKPIYPETIKYTLLATGCFFLLGCMLYFIFRSQKEQYPYNINGWN